MSVPALRAAAAAQRDGKTTVLEMMVTRELGDPFRRDALGAARAPSRQIQADGGALRAHDDRRADASIAPGSSRAAGDDRAAMSAAQKHPERAAPRTSTRQAKWRRWWRAPA